MALEAFVSDSTPNGEQPSWTAGQYARAGAAEQILATLVAWSSRQLDQAGPQGRVRWQALSAQYNRELRAFDASDSREVERIIREYGPAARAIAEGSQ
jgi:hypothetical protein